MMTIGNVRLVDIEQEMRESYLDYAMSVIVARALPDVRDGLKPVQRRILYAMHDLGLTSDKPYRKSARIVGEVLGKYHPHGEAAVYDAMARMAQPFTMRYPLVDGQGNFGSVDGDSPAAMRYTEARLAPVASYMLADIDKDTIDLVDNFDASLKEPVVLPAALPNLLANGASGIAVGMATNVPPHNLGELCDAIAHVVDRYDELDDITVEELLQFLPGPDFPTGGLIMGKEGIAAAYATGKGRLIIRATTAIEQLKSGRQAIIVTEIPYQLSKAALLEKIAALVRVGRLDSVADLRDESDREGMRIVIELKRGAEAPKVLNQLFKWTPLQTTYAINMLALVDGQPRLLSLKRAIHLYIEHRIQVIERRSRFELERALRRLHVLEGLLIALDHIDAVIETIRSSADAEVAQARLQERFGLTEEQARAILDMQLRRLASLERQKLLEEHAQVKAESKRLQALLSERRLVLQAIKEELAKIKSQHADARRTRIVDESAEPFADEDLIIDEPMLVTITRRGYIKKLPIRTYRLQARGGRGITGAQTGDEDDVAHLLATTNLSTVYFFTNRGRVFARMAHSIPDASRTARGASLANVVPLESGERVSAVLSVPREHSQAFLCMVTRRGRLKRLNLEEIATLRASGIRIVALEEGDELAAVRLTSGKDELVLVTARGRAVRLDEATIRPQGRVARGVSGLRLAEDDWVVGLEVVEPGGCLLLVTEKGYGKRVPFTDYPRQSRAARGVLTFKEGAISRLGLVAACEATQDSEEITVITANGLAMRMRASEVPKTSRYANGALLMRLHDGDVVASVARIPGSNGAST
jgi:DNA gyrase subunit A